MIKKFLVGCLKGVEVLLAILFVLLVLEWLYQTFGTGGFIIFDCVCFILTFGYAEATYQ